MSFLAPLLKGALGVCALLLLVGCAQVLRNSGDGALAARDASALRVATWNVHYIILEQDTGPWSRGDWERRKGPMAAGFNALSADLVAFQEMESFARGPNAPVNLTLDWLLAQNPGFGASAVGDPAAFPWTQPILYRRDRLMLQDQGWFFFSETPDVIYSRTFDGSWPAFATWARFTDRTTGAEFRVVNMHTDFSSRSNRLKSAELIAKRIAPWIGAGETVLVMGDMNARAGARTLRIIEAAGVTFAPVRGATYHLNRGLNLFGAIDHIGWVGAARMASAPVVVRRQFDGAWPSDHYPVVLDLVLGD